MTAATKTPKEILTQMTWLPCGHCHGDRCCSCDAQGDDDGPCPSCQDSDGTATGLLMPGLSEGCPGDGPWSHIILEKLRSINPDVYRECLCSGRNRIPRRHDVLEAVLEVILDMDWGIYEVSYSGISVGQFPHGCHTGTGDTLTEKAISGLHQALVAKGLVE